VKEDGTFTLSNVGAEHFNIMMTGLPEGFYVKAIRSGDNDVLTAGLDMSRGPAGPIEITLSPNARPGRCVVQNDKQQPATGATVVLIPQETEPPRPDVLLQDDDNRSVRQVHGPRTSIWRVQSLCLGRHGIRRLYGLGSREARREFGEAVTVRESSKENLQLKLIPAEAQAGDSGRPAANP